MLRKPSPRVCGSFYPAEEKTLYNTVDRLLEEGQQEEKKARAIVVPHAGYVFSGKVAGMTYSSVKIPDAVVILCPNHTGLGDPVAVMNEGSWEIPGARLEIDSSLAELLLNESSIASVDPEAHRAEHSIEVQLPFIFRKNPEVRIVPVCLGITGYQAGKDLSLALASVVEEYEGEVLLIASSDMSHFISKDEARKKDMAAIEKIKQLDMSGLLEVVREKEVSMCGALPTAAVIGAAKRLGSQNAQLIHYNTSAESTGDSSEVVAYAGLRIM